MGHNKREQQSHVNLITISEIYDVISTFVFNVIIFLLEVCDEGVTMCCAYCSGVIGFMLCSTAGPFVNFREACNPIEQVVEDKGSTRRPLRFYNSAVSVCLHLHTSQTLFSTLTLITHSFHLLKLQHPINAYQTHCCNFISILYSC